MGLSAAHLGRLLFEEMLWTGQTPRAEENDTSYRRKGFGKAGGITIVRRKREKMTPAGDRHRSKPNGGGFPTWKAQTGTLNEEGHRTLRRIS